MSFNFMATVTVHNDFGAKEINLPLLLLFTFLLAMKYIQSILHMPYLILKSTSETCIVFIIQMK